MYEKLIYIYTCSIYSYSKLHYEILSYIMSYFIMLSYMLSYMLSNDML